MMNYDRRTERLFGHGLHRAGLEDYTHWRAETRHCNLDEGPRRW